MAVYMERLNKLMKEKPDNIVLMSEGKSHGLTFSVLDRNSGKVYSWLKSHGIGREDMILICLPRGVRTVVAMIGVLKAGAAFAIVESTYSPDRIAFIRKDSGCVLTIDEDLFTDMMEAEYLDGFEKTDPHDLAYAVYTSGTTGNPKGVLHEYGNVDQACESLNYEGKPAGDENSKTAMVAPLNFVASTIIIFNGLILGGTTYIVPYSTVKNLKKLMEFLITEKISHTFMTASLVRVFRNPPETLKTVYVSSEPANGISLEGVNLYNLYAMSETGFAATMFRIDRPYKEAPIGKPQFDLETYILDEQGNPVPDGEMGELCFDNEYVRGYMNLPEKTAESFKNGVFHSGDIARRNPDGNIVLLGRNDDMIKINGNRIEPAEIEAAVKAALGLANVVAKGFDNGKRAYVCAYYLKSEPKADYAMEMTEKIDELNEILLKRIPYYMLPTYYVALDEFPMNANGKLSRKSLKEPDAALFRAEYRAPSNEAEEALCAAFEKVLKVEKIGVDDDFYLLGGDSIAAMELLTKGGVKGFEMGDLFKYHTPAKIAEALAGRETGGDDDEEEAKAREEGVGLDDEQTFDVDFQFEDPMSTMFNLTQLFRMKEGTDAERLAAATEKVMRNHAAFSSKIVFNEDCDMVFEYDSDIFTAPEIIDIKEDEFLKIRGSLRKPFTRITGQPLYRVNIYRTEKNVYLLSDIWHVITDGTSLGLMRNEIARCYNDPEAELGKDYFYLVNKRQLQLDGSELWNEAEKYFDQFDVSSYQTLPEFDNEEFNLKAGRYEGDMGLDQKKLEASPIVESMGKNAFFNMAFALTTSALSGSEKQLVQTLVNGRDSLIKLNTFALLYRSMPIFFDFGRNRTIGEIFEETKTAMQKAVAFSSFPATDYLEIDETTCLIYQKDIYSLGQFGDLVEEYIELKSNDSADDILEVNVIEEGTSQSIMVNYSSAMYEDETMDTLMNTFRRVAALLLEYGDRPESRIDDILRMV